MKSNQKVPKQRVISNIKLFSVFKHEGHEYMVDEIYPYNVKCIRDDGRIESFSIGDLVMFGLEDSLPTKENYKKIS